MCVGRERAWIHVQGFRLSSSIRLTGFNITPLPKLHATANFCSMKKKSRIFSVTGDLYPQQPKKNPEVYFCLFVPFCLKPDWRCIAFPNSKCTRTLLNLQLVGREEEKVFARRRSRVKKIQWMCYRIALNLIFVIFFLTLYLKYYSDWRQAIGKKM